MARFGFTGRTRDTYGNIKGNVDVSIYNAGTSTPSSVFTSISGGTVITTAPQTTSDSDGLFTFYVDNTVTSQDTLFDISIEDATYSYIDIFNSRGCFGTGTLTVNSATPDVSEYPTYITANTTTTVITNLTNAPVGKTVTIVFGDRDTVVGFGEDGTYMRGNGEINWYANQGEHMVCSYIGGYWYCTISSSL